MEKLMYHTQCHRIMDINITSRFPYTLDTFQVQAAEAIERGDHVLVTSHTGSGKSFCGEYAIVKAFLENKRIIYTSPIKTLSNQKFAEFKKKFHDLAGDAGIGIQTGDVKLHPEAQCLIMTTEILRNMLFRGDALDDLAYVVFDEVHYINDKDRGQVWEECILKLPPHVHMIMLSATMANPQDFADWIRTIKPTKDVILCSNDKRPVPLCFYMCVPNPTTFEETSPWEEAMQQGHIAHIMDEKHRFQHDTYTSMARRWKAYEANMFDDHPKPNQPPPKKAPFDMLSLLNPLLNFLHINQLVPAIFFTLSRKRCDQLAQSVQVCMINHEERREIEDIFDFHIRKLNNYEQYSQVTQMKQWLMKGIAVHHSGLFPILKEIVEIIFAKGLIKVLFATETFAIGINMPTKTVVFLDVIKFNEDGKRPLYVEEFKQMAGRAGRRGLDKIGHVIYLPVKEPLSLNEMERMMTGTIKSITSKFAVTPTYVLRTIAGRNATTEPNVFEVTHDTMVQKEHLRMGDGCIQELNALQQTTHTLEAKLNDLDPSNQMRAIAQDVATLEQKKTTASAKAKKTIDRNIQDILSNLSKTEHRTYEHVHSYLCELHTLNKKIKKLRQEADDTPYLLDDQIRRCIAFLQEQGYILPDTPTDQLTSKHLTHKAIFTNEISQCNELCLAHVIFASNLLATIQNDPIKLATALSLFIDEADKVDNQVTSLPLPIMELLRDIASQSECLMDDLGKHHIFVSPNVSMQYTAPVWEWCEGKHFQTLCVDYNIFEGNMVRTLQKLINLLDEMKKAFEILQDMEWVSAIEKTKLLVHTDILQTNSIYLTY